jgi:hypothetical protein
MTRDVPHREAVSTLTWAALATRPITTFTGAAAPFFVANAGPALLEAIKRTSRHLPFTHGEANSPLKALQTRTAALPRTGAPHRGTRPSSTAAPSLDPRSGRPPPRPPPSATMSLVSSVSDSGEAGQLAGFLKGPLIFLVGFQPQLVFESC